MKILEQSMWESCPICGTPEGEMYKETVEKVIEQHKNGIPVYIKIDSGNYKDSIAKLTSDSEITLSKQLHFVKNQYMYYYSIFGRLIWDGRKNNIQCYRGNIILDYDGPTVFNKFDAKAAKEQIIKAGCRDIDGKELSVGDNVLYINARYGSGMKLCHGTIVAIDAKASYFEKDIIVVVEENSTKGKSKIKGPADFIWKY